MPWGNGWQGDWFAQWFGANGEPPTPEPTPSGPRMFGTGRAWDRHWTTAEDMEDQARRTRQQRQVEATLMAWLQVQ